jgi:murein L,D-transpeptidase YcbB/YkuD
MGKKLLLGSAAILGLCVCGFGHAQAQESAMDFMRHEYNRQHSAQQAQPNSFFARGNWGNQSYGGRAWSSYAEWSPPQDLGDGREPLRTGPQVHVDNPDFLNYTPDRPQTKSLAKACEPPADAQASLLGDQANASGDQANTVAPVPASDFAKACAAIQGLTVTALPQVAEALIAYYGAHPQFVWVQDGTISQRAYDVIKTLANAGKYGLDPADYQIAIPPRPDNESARLQALLRFEFALSAKVLTYVLDANRGRVDPNRISGYHDLPRKSVDLAAAMNEIATSKDVAATLAAQNPDNEQFRTLVSELARLRAEAPQAAQPAPHSRKHAAGSSKENDTATKIQKVEFALERLRWLPRQFGDTYVFLNQPAFEVSYVQKGKTPLTMRAVIGKPSAQTYFFVDKIKDVEYNPYWNVPRSIVINEMLPRLYRDPSWLNQKGYEVANDHGRQIASNSVNWAAFARDKTSVDVRQPPGERNALGRVKIEFPNKHAIYMHDTPEKSFFKRDMRALSHGCVRLQNPREMAAAILGTSVDHVDQRIASKQTDKEFVKRDIPVYLTYFTAWPDAEGKVHFYDDVYSRDAHLKIAFEKTEAARKAQ